MEGRAMAQHESRNRLLAALSSDDYALLQPHLEPVSYKLRQVLFCAGEPIDHVLFPESGLISVVADSEQGRFELARTGWEGLVGVPLVLNVGHTPHTALVQSGGQGLRIPAQRLSTAIERSGSLHSFLLRFVHTFVVQLGQTAYANAGYDLEARLARWILMTHDRVDGDELHLTHEFMATMLGTGRPGVTFAVQVLEGDGLIRARRGRMIILNRPGLENLAGKAYGLSEREYARQFPVKQNE
jgi:CRP-like cAMP-binding protein